jgi:hypothetical protein
MKTEPEEIIDNPEGEEVVLVLKAIFKSFYPLNLN